MLRPFLLLSPFSLLLSSALAGTVYSTGFETSDGFTNGLPLAGYGGWVGVVSGPAWTNAAGTAGNGVTNNAFSGQGQNGYAGSKPMTNLYNKLSTWPTITAVSASATNVVFSTVMKIVGSTGNYEAYSWDIFNAQSNLLFNLLFDDNSGVVTCFLSASNTTYTVPAGSGFPENSNFNLVFTMNPASNLWTATINGSPWVSSKLMAPAGTNRSIGFIAASYRVFDTFTNSPGNGYMVFDNYQITADTVGTTAPARPVVSMVSAKAYSATRVRVTAQNGFNFALDASTNLAATNWAPLVTNLVTTNYFDYSDSGAAALPLRTYRARWVP